MVITNRTHPTELAQMMDEEASAKYFGNSAPFGNWIIQTAEELFPQYDYEKLDVDETSPEHQALLKEINAHKQWLVGFVKSGQGGKVADFFGASHTSMIRYDLGQDLQEASAMALEGRESEMYFSPYPAELYRLIKYFNPGHILASSDEANYTQEGVIKAIEAIPPSQFVRTIYGYHERIYHKAEQYAQVAEQTSEFLNNLNYDLFEDILTEAEFNALMEGIRARSASMPVHIIDPLNVPQDNTSAGFYVPLHMNLDYSPSDSVNLVVDFHADKDEIRHLVLHENGHGLFQGMRFFLNQEQQLVPSLSGFHSYTGKATYVWINEAFTEMLTAYLQESSSRKVKFDLDFMQEVTSTGKYSYLPEIRLALMLAKEGAISPIDTLRVYLGFNPRGEDQPGVAKLMRAISAQTQKYFGLSIFQVEEAYAAIQYPEIDKLLNLARYIKERNIKIPTDIKGKPDPLNYFARYNYDPDKIAEQILPPKLKVLFELMRKHQGGIYIDGSPLTPYLAMDIGGSFNWDHGSLITPPVKKPAKEQA